MPAPKRASSKSPLRRAAVLVVSAVVGGVVGAFLAHTGVSAGERLALSTGETIALVALAILVLPLGVLWHELGHIFGGKAVGFRPALLVVGPIRWQEVGGRWRMSANRSTALMGGLAVCLPDDSVALVRRTGTVIAAGPAASLLGALVGVGVWAALPPLDAESSFAAAAAYTVLAAFGFANLLFAALSLIPMQAGGFYSDGARLLRMMRGGPELDREVAVLVITGATVSGVRPRDWDPDLVRRAVGEADGSLFHVSGLQLAFAHAQDRGADDEARALMHSILEAEEVMPPMLRPALRLGMVYFVAVRERDAVRARELLETSKGGLLFDVHARHVASAAVAWVSGDAATAAAELERAEAALPAAVDRGAAAVSAERVAELRGLLREAPEPALA